MKNSLNFKKTIELISSSLHLKMLNAYQKYDAKNK